MGQTRRHTPGQGGSRGLGEPGAESGAGVPVWRAGGAKGGGVLLALKSGNFGGAEFFSDALKLMK